jgi:hypothetical protein
MRVATGKVVGGKVVVGGEAFADGAEVTVIAGDDNELFTASPEQVANLLLAVAETERGEVVSAGALLERLRRIACRPGFELAYHCARQHRSKRLPFSGRIAAPLLRAQFGRNLSAPSHYWPFSRVLELARLMCDYGASGVCTSHAFTTMFTTVRMIRSSTSWPFGIQVGAAHRQ